MTLVTAYALMGGLAGIIVGGVLVYVMLTL